MLSKTYEGDRRELLDALEDQVSEATLEWREARRATRAAVRRHEAIVAANEEEFSRQIRLREMLEKTRLALTETQTSLEEARKDCAIMTRAAQLTASYRKEWEELWSPAESENDIDDMEVVSDTDDEETIEEDIGREREDGAEERGPALDGRSTVQSPPPVIAMSRSAVVEGLDDTAEDRELRELSEAETMLEPVRTRFIPNADGRGGALVVRQEFRWSSIDDLENDHNTLNV